MKEGKKNLTLAKNHCACIYICYIRYETGILP